MLVVGKTVVDWVAKRTNEFGNFGTDVGIGWKRFIVPKEDIFNSYAGFDVHEGKIGYWELVAGVAYANWNGVNVECHIASDGSRKWLTKQYLWTIFDYPFNQLGADRITVCVGEGNTDSTRFVKHLGFILEARLKGAHPTGDLLIFRLLRHDCRWIRMRKHHEKLAA